MAARKWLSTTAGMPSIACVGCTLEKSNKQVTIVIHLPTSLSCAKEIRKAIDSDYKGESSDTADDIDYEDWLAQVEVEKIPAEVLETLPVGQIGVMNAAGAVIKTVHLPCKRFFFKIDELPLVTQFTIAVNSSETDAADGGEEKFVFRAPPPPLIRGRMRRDISQGPGPAPGQMPPPQAKIPLNARDIDRFLSPHASRRELGQQRIYRPDIGISGEHEAAIGTDLLRSLGNSSSEGKNAEKRFLQEVSAISLALHNERQAHDQPGREELPRVNAPDLSHNDRCFLEREARASLISRLDSAYAEKNCRADTVIVLPTEELEAIAGPAAVAAMHEVFGMPIDRIKLRRVEAVSRNDSAHSGNVINFHLDVAKRTMGIALNDDTEYEGSRLVFAVPGAGIVVPRRAAGCATIHNNTVPHGVTALTRGVRYGMFLLSDA